jgi:hypothetical protein
MATENHKATSPELNQPLRTEAEAKAAARPLMKRDYSDLEEPIASLLGGAETLWAVAERMAMIPGGGVKDDEETRVLFFLAEKMLADARAAREIFYAAGDDENGGAS